MSSFEKITCTQLIDRMFLSSGREPIIGGEAKLLHALENYPTKYGLSNYASLHRKHSIGVNHGKG